MINTLRTAIYNLLVEVTSLDTTNIFYVEAPQGSALPFCVFSEFANPFSFDSFSIYETVYVQFTLFDVRVSILESLVKNVKTKFDFGKENLSISGYNVITCVRMADLPPQKFENVYSIVLQYKIELQKSRS